MNNGSTWNITNPADFQTVSSASDQVIQRLIRYAELLEDWQGRMNLVGPKTIADVWNRHFADSAQLLNLVEQGGSWVDIGAGAGFPGMVVAAMDWGHVTLVESLQKKVRFLETVRDELGLQDRVRIICGRAESVAPIGATVGTARAVAPLVRLIPWVSRHLAPDGVMLLMKGRNWAAEVEDAKRHFRFDVEAVASKTDPDARILRLRMQKDARCG